MDIQGLLEKIAASTKNVYGEPVTVGNRVVIPAARFRYGFGGGAGRRKSESDLPGGGGGGRITARPCGAIEISPEGTRFIDFDSRTHLGIGIAIGILCGAAITAMAQR